MPGFATHYLFGVSAFKHSKQDNFRTLIQKHHDAYGLGLQGPDIFFYYLPGLRFSPNPGSIVHKYRTNAFFLALFESLKLCKNRADYETALSYIAGFLAHHTLDASTHPYIYARTHYKEDTPAYFGTHVYLETDIDAEMLSHFKQMRPLEFYSDQTVRLPKRKRHVIAKCLYFAYRNVFPEMHITRADITAAVFFMPHALSILRDPYGKKKVFIRWAERHILGCAYVSPLIASDQLRFTHDPLNLRHKTWKNPWNTTFASTDSFFDLFHTAEKKYLDRICLIHDLFCRNPFVRTDAHFNLAGQLEPLLTSLGNHSYSSDLPL